MKIDLSEKNINKNIVLGVAYKPISMLLSYIYVPVALSFLGEEKYGVWATILSVLSWISLFDIGIGNGLRNKLAECFTNNNDDDEHSVKKYVSSAYIMLAIIVFSAMALFIVVFSFINWNVFFKVGKDFEDNLRLVMILSTVFMCISFVLSICKSIYRAMQSNHIVNLMGVLQQALMLLSILVLSKMTSNNLVYVAIIYGASDLIVELIFTFQLFRTNRCFVPNLKYFSKKEAKATTNLGILFFIVQIATMVLYTTDNIIITQVVGASEVTSYTTANKLFSMITAVFSIVVAPYWSAITAYKSQKDWRAINTGKKKMLTLWGMATFGCILLIIVFKPIVRIWLGRTLHFQEGLVPLMAVYAIIYMWNTVYAQIGNGLEMMKVSVINAILQGVINIPLSLVFAVSFHMGTVGVLLGTVLSMSISAIVMPIYIKKFLNNVVQK